LGSISYRLHATGYKLLATGSCLPGEDGEQSRVVVGPGADAGLQVGVEGVGDQVGLLEKGGVVGDQHPGGGIAAGSLFSQGMNVAGLHSGGGGENRDGRFEIDVAVGDVEGEDSARREMAAVELEGFAGEQVDGDGVAREGVDDEHVEVLRRFMGQGVAGVSDDDIDLGAGVADIGEDVAGNGDHGGIDVVEGDVVAGAAVSGDGSGAEADDADATGAGCGAIGARPTPESRV